LNTPFGFGIKGLATPEDPSNYDWFISEIEGSSKAYQRGLRNGDQLVRLDGQKLETPMDLQQFLQNLSPNSDAILLETLSTNNEKKFSYFSLKP
ncbi:MAG: PDZ domain-containing protein, partial [Bacteroidota bacterium]